ncbi:hypothetical protein HGP17_24965 [Rhizobium sp. P38BS-XIX]|uniref:hypothetical protein n=1 Tax=Rhizobium sp. P38BS-XIX TaxID=2726740 RepID=UPI00145754B4|nr:hypothetical protein [Rhizobium sp. P38BS-XIX]NLS00090.1 hypothetical protein [Rhizobium sp. P38BS-XIX]
MPVSNDGLGIGRMNFTLIAATIAAVLAICLLLTGLSVGLTVFIAMAAFLVAAVLAFILWPRWRWSRLQERFPEHLHMQDVRKLLGAPPQAIETFPGDVVECWIYPPRSLLAGEPIGVGMAFDFDAKGRVLSMRRQRGR